jgi:hypothetical protein
MNILIMARDFFDETTQPLAQFLTDMPDMIIHLIRFILTQLFEFFSLFVGFKRNGPLANQKPNQSQTPATSTSQPSVHSSSLENKSIQGDSVAKQNDSMYAWCTTFNAFFAVFIIVAIGLVVDSINRYPTGQEVPQQQELVEEEVDRRPRRR